MAEYLIQEETLAAFANQARRFGGTEDLMTPVEVLEILSKIQGEIRSEEGAYLIQAFGYNNKLLKSEQMNTGEIFALPRDMSYPDNLKCIGWRVTNLDDTTENFIIVDNNDMVAVKEFESKSGASELTVLITDDKKTITFYNLENATRINWGDGIENNDLSHTYASAGEYIIQIYDATVISVDADCRDLVTSIVFSNNMTIPWKGYSGYSNLTNIIIPNGIATIEGYAFDGLNNLISVMLNKGITSIETVAFSNCTDLKHIIIPGSVTSLGESIFAQCTSLESVILEYGVPLITQTMFNGCTNLKSITIPNSVTSIGINAFSNCTSLTTITIPSSITSIGSKAFYRCINLENIIVDSNNNEYSSLNGVLFNKDASNLICYPIGGEGIYTIPDGVTNIDNYAFQYCTNLTDIIIPKSVTSIGTQAFYSCDNLVSAVYQGTAEEWSKVSIGSNNTQLTRIITFAG